MNEVDERFSIRGSAQAWNDLYDVETESLHDCNFRRRRDFTVAYVLKNVKAGARVLDLGCGAGPVVSELRRHGMDCVGLDGAPDMLDYARQRLQSLSQSPLNLLRGDCSHTPFQSGAFDLVVCLGVISYVEDKQGMLREIQRVLKPGGTLILSFRNKFNPVLSDPAILGQALFQWMRRKPERFQIGQFLDHRAVKAGMEAAGFRFIEFKGIGFGPFSFCRRRLFSERTSMKLSHALARFFEVKLPGWCARWMTDVSIWVYRA